TLVAAAEHDFVASEARSTCHLSLDLELPELLAGLRVDAKEVARLVAHVNAIITHRRRRLERVRGGETPLFPAIGEIDRVEGLVSCRNVSAAADNGGRPLDRVLALAGLELPELDELLGELLAADAVLRRVAAEERPVSRDGRERDQNKREGSGRLH